MSHTSLKPSNVLTKNVLTKIVATKAAHIAALKLRFPEDSLQPKISDRSLFEALKAPDAGFIFECKKASPSKGLIRADFDVEAIADIYVNYAAGISVLTDEQFFQGDMDYLPKVRARVTQPVLCKDFFVDPYQIKLAAHQGADAILLMLSVLDDEQYRALAHEAAKYQLDILTEVSNEEELKRAIDLDAPIIGINNRNLRDLSTDLATTETLAPHIPADRVVISESGIYNQSQVRRLSPLVDGFLVGSSLMAEPDLDLACRALTLGHNKVCGLTRAEDAKAAAQAGAIYGGLIFAPQSARYISPEKAHNLIKQQSASNKRLKYVGVFVNEEINKIVEVATALSLFAVQLHGSETQYEIDELRLALQDANCQCEIWKAIAIESSTDAKLPELKQSELKLPEHVDRLLYDSKTQTANASQFGETGQFGGTGQCFNWQLPLPKKQQAMLAGGLSADNAFDAAKQGFFGLDFNSGLEREPGIKDHQKIADAFAALRHY
ncbi:bifunctional indole-3-glycerol-phosphate synthase TrpC/phosphoribosylanthranilate isomerase TrpF [Shewanella sp. AS1]|uniref:bifunctional indole-3-glycerol-phosphate synthase TrpC/phosphoribosylanthranilate isomerase TrpF n=1 Tax=Shewanella sp. AS1 TaxID=2907626 RepID=UPI001F2114C1|nr:bifunctional indole-3-glycerol-phosphate synthase TrpC/phosphoribosylanthranilate isomerase TrpF [Shewanella sp. AS1]MCE9678665.1 bifunctional indole-3-glycerol-phosphate synthase TrpC/phosphoribosylanthranilate isomerase TrpF [Shewanella sp. AS1]